MINHNQQENPTKRLRSVQEILDHEFMTIGDHFGKIWTQEELEESRKIADCYEELLLQGCTDEQIDALWEGKTNQEILDTIYKSAQTGQAVNF